MTESLISTVTNQLFAILGEKAAQELKLVTNLDEEVQKLTNNLHAIQVVIEDAERRQVNESAVKLWLHNLKDVCYDIDDVLDDWHTTILKHKMEQEAEASVEDAPHLSKKVRYTFNNLSSRFSFPRVLLRHDIAISIEKLNGRLDAITNQRNRYNFKLEKGSHEQRTITTSIINESEVFVREDDERKIKEMLLCESSAETSNPCIISIVGMGGIGKTTLARLAYNDVEVKSQFDVRIWICVSEPFEEERIAVEILESLLDEKPNFVGRDNILQKICKYVSGKKVLLVLDDVWTEDSNDWEQLKGSLKTCSPGSRILTTTRKQMVAKSMGSRTTDMFFLEQLSMEKCWSLFSRRAFFDRTTEECQNLEEIGRKILERCKGLPLAVKVVGGLLRFRETKEQWQCILDSEMWEIEEVEKGVFPPLLLSYYDLPPVLRQCFSYCAIFPKDHDIEKEKLIKLWMAQGFLKKTGHKNMKIIGEEYFNKLVMLSLFQDIDNYGAKTCKMHDIVHDFAQFLTTKDKPSFESIRHLMMVARIETVDISSENWRKLRTLLTVGWRLESLLNSIDDLTCLRAFDISWSIGSMLSEKIGKLTHLRYLNLSGNRDLKSLPEAICDLYNLQNLDISWCGQLKELPCGMGKLINLVYLDNSHTDLRFMPKGMERLTCLQTLNLYVVSSDGGSCSVEGLGKLIHLQGHLTVRILGNVVKRSEEKEALQPPSCLEKLEILHFEGLLFPNWMMSFTMLKEVALHDFQNCETLPPLGKLPFLEKLYISHMDKVKKVGEEFLGMEREEGQAPSFSCNSNNYIAFPKLNRLEFCCLRNWEEWEYGKLSSISTEEAASSCCFTIMPCLQHLEIEDCPLLKMVPHQILYIPTIQILDARGKLIPKERFGTT